MQGVACEIDRVWHHQRQHDRKLVVGKLQLIEQLLQADETEGHDQPDRNAADRNKHECERSLHRREDAGQRGHHGKPVDHQSRRVVHEPFAVEDSDHATRYREALENGRGSDRVRRRHDRS